VRTYKEDGGSSSRGETMKHPFTDEDMIAAADGLWQGSTVLKPIDFAVQALWNSAVARGAVDKKSYIYPKGAKYIIKVPKG
jgi:hypothetical protein